MKERTRIWSLRVYTALMYMLFFAPPMYIVYLSFFDRPSATVLIPETFTLQWFHRALESGILINGLKTSIIISSIAALIATVFALLGARAYFKLSNSARQPLFLLFIHPLLIPGIILGFSLIVYYNMIGVGTGNLTLLVTSLIWVLPFALLITLTSLSNLDPDLRRASYDLGASRLETFYKIELPQIFPGILGSFIFSFIFAFNEYIRTSFVGGNEFTFPAYIYSTVTTGGIPPEAFAISAVIVLTTTLLILIYIGYTRYTTDY